MPNVEHIKREGRLEVRVSNDIKVLCQRAAKLQGRTLTDFVVHTVVEAAKRTIHESEFMELTLRDRTAFVEALLNPPTPNTKLRKAMARRTELVVT